MDREETSLTEDEITAVDIGWCEIPNFNDEQFGEYYHEIKHAIADTATDKAIRKLISEVIGQGKPTDKLRHLTARLGCEASLLRYDKIMQIGHEIDAEIIRIEDLKKLIGGTK